MTVMRHELPILIRVITCTSQIESGFNHTPRYFIHTIIIKLLTKMVEAQP